DLPGDDLVVEGEYPVHQALRSRRAPRDVDVHRDDLVDTLDQGVVVEHATRRSTGTHRDDPLRVGHLVVDLTQHGGHLLTDTTGYDHQVGLTGRSPEHLHAETAQVVVGGAGRHHLDGATGQPE